MTDNDQQHPVLEQIRACCLALDEKQALDLKVLDVRGKSSVTDYLIIGSGNSEPHLRALRIATEDAVRDAEVEMLGIDYQEQSGWLVVDAFEFMVHLFLQEQRDVYRIESLWKDAEDITDQIFAAQPKSVR